MRIRYLVMALGMALGLLFLGGKALAQPSMGREHMLPLFLSTSNSSFTPTASVEQQEGFVRVINHSDEEATVHITGYDDAGQAGGSATLTLGAKRTIHLNSRDVENGNADKNLSGGLGASSGGNWRLHLRSEQDIEPLAYIRTRPDGFLTSMSAAAPEGRMRHRVSIFNPASNFNQKSWLRLVNLSDNEATVTISGVDDAAEAASGGEVSLSLAAHEAKAVFSEDLEPGGSGLTGMLGDGAGKWQLKVAADQPITVMSLMSTPTGHLSNLSAPKADYAGPANFWKLSFTDGVEDDGYLVVMPDSRLYGWLPEMEETRIADGTYDADSGRLEASGALYESGEIDIAGTSIEGGSEPFELSATYRQDDWITGSYTVGGVSRTFNGSAFPGFDRGADAVSLAGDWTTTDSDLSYSVDAAAEFSGSLEVASFECDLSGTLGGVNPAFNLYESVVEVDCTLIRLDVELIIAVSDQPNAPGGGDHALALVIARDDEIAVGVTAVR
ncbi:MAG: hypothetical protein F4X81_10545 [Gammaproteobacteria bacterium]|nr:hypothetical protein [Gammaproteobacteria bacterium]MYE51890.1 hypothetical protein [Gammaproteobacteria bacterium]